MRQLVLQSFPDISGLVVLKDREFRYLAQVLRLGAGDVVGARFPDGTLASMLVASVDRKGRSISLQKVPDSANAASSSRSNDGGSEEGVLAASCAAGDSMPAIAAVPEGFPRIVLFQWILKGPKMDQVIRQATEAGVELIVPVAGERCLSRDADSVGDGKTGRWDRIVREARQQSGSPVPTRIVPPVPPAGIGTVLRDVSAVSAACDAVSRLAALVLTEAPLARKSLHEYLGSVPDITALAVGPEGGMTARELDLLAGAGFACIHFRTNILRAETAALYGIAAVQSVLTESEKWQLKE
jgi:16S rRNA (uracil1498-N3)-methyltransferase